MLTPVSAVPFVAEVGAPPPPEPPEPPVETGEWSPPVNFSSPAWACEWMVGRDEVYTTAKAVALAQRFDIVAGYDPLQPFLPAMRAANPNFRIFYYNLGPFANTRQSGSYPEEWFAHDATGARIMTRTFGTYLMNNASPGWRAKQLELAINSTKAHGYDGPFMDSMGQGGIGTGYVTAAPIDPRTGQPWTAARWVQDSMEFMETLKAESGMPVLANGLGDGNAYATSKGLAYAADLAMSERWLRDPHASLTAFPSVSQWLKDVDMIVDAEANGGAIGTVTKLWTGPPTAAQQAQWYQYAQASFLLGTNGRSRMFFLQDGAAPATNGGVGASGLETQPSPSLAIGTPTGAYTAQGNAYVRTYTNGFVAVNPTSAAVTVNLPAGTTYNRSDASTTATGTISLGAYRGVTLTSAGVEAAPYIPAADWHWSAIPSSPVVDTNSAAYVDTLVNTAGNQNKVIAYYDYGVPVWEIPIGSSAPTYTVPATKYHVRTVNGVRIPNEAAPQPGSPDASDGAMIIFDYPNNKLHEFYEAQKPGGTWTCGDMTTFPLNGDGRTGGDINVGQSGWGCTRAAGLILRSELAAAWATDGDLGHALVFSTNVAAPSTFRYPALKTDGSNMAGGATPIPEGARLQLDPSYNVNGSSLTKLEKILARTLQKYGAYCIDNGGSRVTFNLEGDDTGTASYEPGVDPGNPGSSGGWATAYGISGSGYFSIANLPWSQMRVLKNWNGAA